MPQSFDSTVTLSASGTYSLIPVGVPYGRDGYQLRVTGSGWAGSLVLVENQAPPGSAANYVNVAYQNANTLLQVAAGTAITGDGTFIVPVRGYDVAVQYTHTAGSVTLAVSPAHGINRDEADDVGFSQGGTGSAEVTVAAKLRETISVTDFGAVGDGVTDDTAAIQRAIDTRSGIVFFPEGTYRISDTLELYSGSILRGANKQRTIISYVGSGVAITSVSPGVRTFSWALSDFRLDDNGTGTTGILMDSVSLSDIRNIEVRNFDVQIDMYSPTSGFSVYNRCYDVLVQGPTGFKLSGLSTNAHTFIGCRTNLGTVRGVDITDSNDNSFIACQFESGGAGTAVYVTAAVAGTAPGNRFIGCRIETYSGGIGYHIASANVTDTVILFPQNFSTVTTPLDDSGTRTFVWGVNGNTGANKMWSALAAASGTPWVYERTTNGGTEVPHTILRDSNSAGGTPVTLQIETERSTGFFARGRSGGVTQWQVSATGAETVGSVRLQDATPTVSSGEVGLGVTTSTTVGAAGAASALPATPSGYLTINIGGTAFKVPYYAS